MDIYWVRHAVSCANAIKHQHTGWLSRAAEWLMAKRSRQAPNAALHPVGVQQATDAQFYIQSIVQQHGPVVLGASCLRRAVQTAHHLLPSQPIVVLPYISEERRFGLDNDNVCSLEDLRDLDTQSGYTIDLTLYNQHKHPSHPHAAAFYRDVVPQLQQQYPGKAFIIVSHSNFIKQHVLKDATADVYNTSIWKESIDADGTRTLSNPFPHRSVHGLPRNAPLCARKYNDVHVHQRLKMPFLHPT